MIKQNIDISKYKLLNGSSNNLAKIKKTDKDSVRELCCKNIKLPVKLRDTHKVEKKKIVSASVFLVIKVIEEAC